MVGLKVRRGLTLVELLVVIAILAVLIAMLLPVIQAAREAARRVHCMNNMRQIGVALHNHHDALNRLPPGWDAEGPEGPPGWGWASIILPYMEEARSMDSVQESRKKKKAIGHPDNRVVRTMPIPTYLCPSDPTPEIFVIYEKGKKPSSPPDPPGQGKHMFEIARANYAGVFGTLDIEQVPSAGDGVFFHNSLIGFRQISDGLTQTILVGERSSRLGESTWVGSVSGSEMAMQRVVGQTDNVPNDLLAHFADFSSYHVTGAHFLMGDGSVHLISDQIDLGVYRALATRAAGERADTSQIVEGSSFIRLPVALVPLGSLRGAPAAQ